MTNSVVILFESQLTNLKSCCVNQKQHEAYQQNSKQGLKLANKSHGSIKMYF